VTYTLNVMTSTILCDEWALNRYKEGKINKETGNDGRVASTHSYNHRAP